MFNKRNSLDTLFTFTFHLTVFLFCSIVFCIMFFLVHIFLGDDSEKIDVAYNCILLITTVVVTFDRVMRDRNILNLSVYGIVKVAFQLLKQVVVHCTMLVSCIIAVGYFFTTVGYFPTLKEVAYQEILFGLVVEKLSVYWFFAETLIITTKIIDKICELKGNHK